MPKKIKVIETCQACGAPLRSQLELNAWLCSSCLDAECEDDGSVRASGDVLCSICHKPYKRHPPDSRHSYLNVLCDGLKVKL